MERSESVENYLKAIYMLGFDDASVTTSKVAGKLNVSSPSVSAMLRRMQAAELVADTGSGGIALSDHGEWHARGIVRRHRLIETFLARALGMGWDEVHAEAEALEHAASELLIDRIDTALGRPSRDPHGDPIPPKSGDYVEDWGPALAHAPAGARFRVDRVSDDDSDALRYLAELGVRPGVVLHVMDQAPFDGPLWVELEGQQHALGTPLTQLVHGATLP